MPITSITPHPAGTAVRILYTMPPGARAFIVLRKTADTFSGETDPDAAVITAGMNSLDSFIDCSFLTNGTTYFYKAYWTADGIVWNAEPTRSCVPAATYQEGTLDTLTLLRDRIDAAMQVAVARNQLTNERGSIPVLTAPPATDDVVFPVVTLHLTQESSEVRGIGERVTADVQTTDTSWLVSEGWLARVQIAVVGWSLNPDERAILRRALRDSVIANLDVFDDAGLLTVDFSQQDVEDFQSFGVPMYQTMGTFSCLAPVVVSTEEGVIETVVSDSIPFFNKLKFSSSQP